jgi:hypothetical protein
VENVQCDTMVWVWKHDVTLKGRRERHENGTLEMKVLSHFYELIMFPKALPTLRSSLFAKCFISKGRHFPRQQLRVGKNEDDFLVIRNLNFLIHKLLPHQVCRLTSSSSSLSPSSLLEHLLQLICIHNKVILLLLMLLK